MALPRLLYLVAFNNAANDDPGLITTVASPPGTLGGVNVWTDVSRDVVTDSGNRGRSHEMQAMQAGDRVLTLRNESGQYTPWNTAGPYTGLLVPRKPFQVQSKWLGSVYQRFTGQVDSWATSWPDARTQLATLHVTDAFRMLNLAAITTGGYPAQVLADGATGYWRLGDVVGSTRAADSSGNNLTGSPILGVVFGQSGGALLANPGTDAQLATTGATIAIPDGTAWISSAAAGVTIEYWFQSSASTGVAGVGVNLHYKIGGNDEFLTAQVNGPTSVVNVNILYGTASVLTASVNLFDGLWHHVVFSVAAAGPVTIYIDGVSAATSAGAPPASTAPFQNNIFCITAGSPPGSAANLQEVAVYPTALSAAQVANHFDLASFPQEATGARVGRVLNAVGWSAGARAIDAGYSTIQKVTSSLTTTSSLSHLQSVEATEGGALYMSTTGQVTFKSRQTLFSTATYTTPQATFGDNTGAGDIPYLPALTLARDDIDLYNEAAATRTGGNTQISSNPTSITANGRVTWSPPAALNGISDAEVLGLTQYIVGKYATPVDRLAAVTVDLASVANSFPAAMPALLSLDLLYQITVRRTVMPGNATTFNQPGVIEHISEAIDAAANTWTITFGLAVADPAFWVLGVSQLGSTTTLAW